MDAREVVGLDSEHLSPARLVALVEWVKLFHAAAADFDHVLRERVPAVERALRC